jgi:hypothetical protein
MPFYRLFDKNPRAYVVRTSFQHKERNCKVHLPGKTIVLPCATQGCSYKLARLKILKAS